MLYLVLKRDLKYFLGLSDAEVDAKKYRDRLIEFSELTNKHNISLTSSNSILFKMQCSQCAVTSFSNHLWVIYKVVLKLVPIVSITT